jgi:hypothetical protein
MWKCWNFLLNLVWCIYSESCMSIYIWVLFMSNIPFPLTFMQIILWYLNLDFILRNILETHCQLICRANNSINTNQFFIFNIFLILLIYFLLIRIFLRNIFWKIVNYIVNFRANGIIMNNNVSGLIKNISIRLKKC